MSGYFRAYSNRVREATRDLDEENLRVYLALLSFANCEGKCWPGIAKLVSTTGICTDGIYSAIEALATQKYIIIVRRGAHDPETRQQLPNIYKIDGAVIDDDCSDDEFRTDDPILALSSNQESKQQQRTDSVTQPKETKPENTTTTTSDSFEVEVPKPKAKSKAKAKTTEQSSIPNPPNPVPPTPSPRFYTGSLSKYGAALPEEQETAAQRIYVELRHKMPIRHARKLIDDYGVTPVQVAMRFLMRQSNVTNPPGLLRHLLEKTVIEQRDGEAINPGDEYITGEFADYISH